MSSSTESSPWEGGLASEAAVEIDHLDRLPDCILLVILNRIGDVKTLGRCFLVSRRFRALCSLVDDVFVRVDCVISNEPSLSSSFAPGAADRTRRALSRLARIILGGFFRPVQAFGQILMPVTASASRRLSPPSSGTVTVSEVSHHSPTEVLRSFKEIRRLRIQLPSGELGLEGALLKWKARFGSTLESCVILGASSVSPKPLVPSHSLQEAGCSEEGILECCTNGNLKLRVMWTISSLIAASARHYLLHEVIADHEMVESLEMTDADGQGVLTMERWQLQKMRSRPVPASGTSQRTPIPPLRMRLWLASQVELPGGLVLNGATLVAIRPSEELPVEGIDGGVVSQNGCWVSDAFEEPYRTAVRNLMQRRTYCLEMNSF